MDALVINGPTRLSGTVRVHGSKNAALPLIFGSLLFDREIVYENVPRLWDIETTLALLGEMGVECAWDKTAGSVRILPTVARRVAPYEWVSKMRAGILALGPLVARYGEAEVSLPGGCAIGARPVNYHIEALRRMGVTISVDGGYIRATVPSGLHGAEITFPEVSVTGTENVLYVAAVASGVTTIHNAAKEPEVLALGEFLRACGTEIEGLGTETIRVRGGKLTPPDGPVVVGPDRIEASTWVAAAAATGSELLLTHCRPSEMSAVLGAFRDMGVGIEADDESGTIRVHASEKLFPLRLQTSPYPGFPTDMQAQILTVMCRAPGRSEIQENIFENRFMHVAELRRLGARITIHQNRAVVEGGTELIGAPLMATDLRASASLVLAGLCARGQTVVRRIYHLDRGYARLDETLRQLGADITRVSE